MGDLNPTEADLHGYISVLRSTGAGATAGESFLSAWRFMVHTVGAGQAVNNDLISGRVIGASKDLVAKKRTLRQAPPLTAEMVWKLDLDEETKMAVTYSRDAIAATMVKVYRMLETVRKGIFDPDASRAERIAMATGLNHLATHLPEKNEMELDREERLQKEMERAEQCETDVDEDGAEIQPVKIPEESQSGTRSDFPPGESAHCVVHRLSGIVHCMETTDSLLCGRRMSLNMKPIDFPWEERATHEFCEQCNKELYR